MPSGNINNNKTIYGSITGLKSTTASISAGGGSGTSDHTKLINRDAADQHPISAITDLEDILNKKLDSTTIQSIIEELRKDVDDAIATKAKGLYYDAACELAKKPYWYLTSEIDEASKQGTKESIISGPYAFGAGEGGGGTTEVTLDVAIDTVTGERMWPSNISVGSSCIIGMTWTSTRDSKPTGRGMIYCYVNEKLVETKGVNQGLVTFDLTDYIISGTNKIEVKVQDAYSSTKNYIDTINGVELKLASTFEDDLNYSGDIIYTYIPTGNIKKTVHFIVDGIESLIPDIVTTTGEQKNKVIPASVLKTHGAHTLRVYFTVTLSGAEIKSNELFYDIIWCKEGESDPIIASAFNETEEEQYASFTIKYRVVTPNKNTSTIYLITDGVESSPLVVDQTYQNWECRFDVIGDHTLQIKTGSVTKTFNIHVNESSIHVEPITDALELYLDSYGRNNSEPIEERQQWNYITDKTAIYSKLSGFNWVSNGWVQDDNGNTVLRLSGDARAIIEYKPFETDFTATGKTFEFEIATSDVKEYETRIMECLDGADSITYSQGYAGEDTRRNKFIVKGVDSEKFITKVLNVKGTYIFVCDGTNWDLDGTLVSFDDLLNIYGIELEETGTSTEEPSHYISGDRIIIYYTVAGRGFYITPQLAKLQSQQASLSTQYKEGEKVKLAFVVEKRTEGTAAFKTRLIYMYINGILSGVSKYPEGDSFQQTPAAFITIGSNNATLDIYNIRIYNNNLTRKQIVNNWIADTKDPVLKTKRYKNNDNYDDTGKIIIDAEQKQVKGLTTTPYMILNAESLPKYKKDRKYISVEYVNPADDSRNFTAEDARIDVQGTSSQYYYKKNFKIKFEGGFEDKDFNWSEHYKLRGEDSKKEKTFTYKADVASSEGANNVELVRYFEDTKNWFSPAELEPDEDIPGSTDSKKRIRVGIDGFPIIMFHNDGNQTSFYGKMNFNNDKGNSRTFGFKDGDECWEFINNTTPLVLFKTNDLTAWADSFESRYPEEAGSDEHAYGTLPEERTKLQALLDWVVQTYRRPEDSEEEKAAKLSKFRTELSTHFDKTSTLFYYLFTELFLMVDSRAKNAMLAYLKSRQSGDGGNKWFWMPYDMDTALGINNEGLLVFNYDKEDTDLQEGAFIFNGQDSVFWQNVRDAFPKELKTMYNELRAASGSDKVAWSYDLVEKYFEDHQAYWSENIFNEDAYVKYLEPYINDQDATYIGMCQGSKEQQRKWWLYNRFRYIDSKYLAGDAKASDHNIMLRAYQKSDFTITPYINCYVTGIFDQATDDLTVTRKAEKGELITIPAPEHWDPAGVDSVVILYSADLLQEVGDLSKFKPGYADFSKATKLNKLVIGNADSTYENPNLKGLNVGANHLLTYLDARNCKNLGTGEGTEVTPTIDLSNCTSIEEVYFDNTQIKGCAFPVGGNLKVIHLPETLTSLTIRNHPNLTDFKLAGTQNLTSIWLEDVPSSAIDSYSYVMNMPEFSRIRLIGINNNFTDSTQIKNFYDKLDKMHGLDGKGDFVEKAQITGKIYVNEISYSDWYSLTQRYSEVEIIADITRCVISFYNDGELQESYTVIQGNTLYTAVKDPKKESTESTDFTFTNWDIWTPSTIIETDMIVNAVYAESIRKYTITFDKQWNGAEFKNPELEIQTVDWNTNVIQPELTWNDPLVELRGWYLSSTGDDAFDFTQPIKGSYSKIDHVYAQWQDYGTPVLDLTKINYDTIKAHGTDNVGIVAYQIVYNSDTEPADWLEIYPFETDFNRDIKITESGYCYVWIKDSNDNKAKAKINIFNLNKSLTVGIEQLNILENGNLINTDFVVANTEITIEATLDKHYENFEIIVDVTKYVGETIIVQKDLDIIASCSPKKYLVKFDVCEKGATPDSQEITYLTKILNPGEQYYRGYIIGNWYLDKYYTEEKVWDFKNDIITADIIDEETNSITLYAKWIEYRMPSKITIKVTDDEVSDEIKEVFTNAGYTWETRMTMLNYTQTESHALEIDWGDDSEIEYSIETLNPCHLVHTYAAAGEYIIQTQCIGNKNYKLGYAYSYNLIVPASYITKTDFSYDITELWDYALYGSSISELGLTPYITNIPTGMYAACSNLTSIDIPSSVVKIGSSAFEGCHNITGKLIIPDTVKQLGTYCFQNCDGVTEVSISNSVSIIPDYCFADCSLTTLTIPSSVKQIHERAFVNNEFESIEIPETVEYLYNPDASKGVTYGNVFGNCMNLSKVKILGKNTLPCANTFNNCPKLISAGPIGKNKSIEFAWDTVIPSYAFSASDQEFSYIEEVILPSTITEISDHAFYNCKVKTINGAASDIVKTINLPTGLLIIGTLAFAGSSIRNVNVPNTVVKIEGNAFNWCYSLSTINIYTTTELDYKIENPNEGWFIGVPENVDESTCKIHVSKIFTSPEMIKEYFGNYWNLTSVATLTGLRYTNDL